MVGLQVQLGRLTLTNPIMVASGTFGYAREMKEFVAFDQLGAIVPKTITRQPRAGNLPPRTVETPSGLLNSIGLDNDGLECFIEKHLPYLVALESALIVNIAGHDYDEFVTMAEVLGKQSGIAGLELNISCPNVTGGVDFGVDPERTAQVVRGVRQVCSLPVITKLTPNVTDVVAVAEAAREAGADAVSLINTLLGLAVDWRKGTPILGAGMGGLSGPAIKPVALRMVSQVARRVNIPVIGIGGIRSIDDVMEFLMTGASAVQVGTATFFDPAVSGKLRGQLQSHLESLGIMDVNHFIGSLEWPE